MDKVISNHKKKKRNYLLLLVLLVASISVFAFKGFSFDYATSISIEKEKLEIVTVTEGLFEDYINLTGYIEPAEVYFIDAAESGRIEKIRVESGDSVAVGDTLVILTNSDLQLEVMQREAQLLEQLNNQQQTRLLIEQNEIEQQRELSEIEYRFDLIEPRYKRNLQLFSDSVIAAAEFEPLETEYYYCKNQKKITQKAFNYSSRNRTLQLRQIEGTIMRIEKSLIAVRNIMGGLNVIAPINGKLSDFDFKQGESIELGDNIGQIYNFKEKVIRSQVDEFYLGQLKVGMKGLAQWSGKEYKVILQKIYPTVEEGTFRVDCSFLNEVPDVVNKGSSTRLKLNLSKSTNSTLLSNGEFYNQTGGEWVFVIEGNKAKKRIISTGKSNPNYLEVVTGLEPGLKVIVSSYKNLAQYETINIK